MSIGAPIGSAIGAASPDNVATIFNQNVTANVTASVDPTLSVGKLLSAAIDVSAVLGAFSVGKVVAAGIDATVTATKAISYTVGAALIDASAIITKTAGKVVPAALISAGIGSITKTAGKVVSAGVDMASALGNFAVAKLVSASVDVLGTVGRDFALTVVASVSVSATPVKSVGKVIATALMALGARIRRAFTRDTISASVGGGIVPGAATSGGELHEANIGSNLTISGQPGGGTRLKAT